MNWPVIDRNADAIFWDKSLGFFGNKLTNLAQTAADNKFDIEATEDGIAPWDGYANHKSQFPADLKNFQFSILRLSRIADPNKIFKIGAWQLLDLYENRNNPEYRDNIQQIYGKLISKA